MQAINHIATALVIKRQIPEMPLLPLLAATEAIEFTWVGLNLAGVEHVTVDPPGTHISHLHLAHMPFSHSLAGTILTALMIGFVGYLFYDRKPRIAIALALAVLSHILLDLAVHAKDIPLMPFGEGEKFGTGLITYSPFLELLIETVYGFICWRIFGGSKALLAVFALAFVVAAPSYLPPSFGIEMQFDPHSFPLLILTQILVTLGLVYLFAHKTAATLAGARTRT